MAQDLFLSPTTNDLYIDPITGEIRLCGSLQELTRQRILIRLRTYKGEWRYNILFGLPYFQSILKKGSKVATDLIIRNMINKTEGVVKILSFNSELTKDRKYILSFQCQVESGEIVTVNEETL